MGGFIFVFFHFPKFAKVRFWWADIKPLNSKKPQKKTRCTSTVSQKKTKMPKNMVPLS